MQLKYVQSLTKPSPNISKVTAMCWAPNGKKLAVCIDKVVYLYDENGVEQDKFVTKAADKV